MGDGQNLLVVEACAQDGCLLSSLCVPRDVGAGEGERCKRVVDPATFVLKREGGILNNFEEH